MAEKELVTKEKLDYSGLFNFSELYTFAYRWLDVEEDMGVVEKRYNEKIAGNAREIFIEWEASKKLSDYYKISFTIKFDIKDLSDVEVEIEGKKKKMNKGKVSVDIKAYLVIDPNGEWEATPFYRAMRDFYNKYIIPARIKARELKVFGTAVEFKDQLKAFLEMSGRR